MSEEKIFCDSLGEYKLSNGLILVISPVPKDGDLGNGYTKGAMIGLYEDLGDGVMGDEMELKAKDLPDLIKKLKIIVDGEVDEFWKSKTEKKK